MLLWSKCPSPVKVSVLELDFLNHDRSTVSYVPAMSPSYVVERFTQTSPASVMVWGLMEYLFMPAALNALFNRHTQNQYTHELLFSNLVDFRIWPSA